MIEILILYEISKNVLTMYGISREIKKDFSVLTLPSYGTIKPALLRLEKAGYIKSQKTMSKGGRPSVYYSITEFGKKEFVKLLLEKPLENPIQFLTVARAKLICSELINNSEQKVLYKILSDKTESFSLDIKNMLNAPEISFYQKMVFDNLLCEYKNFISLLEGLGRACKD